MLGRIRRRCLLMRSGLLLTLTEIGLRRSGFKSTHGFLHRMARGLPFRWTRRSDPELAQQIADLVDRSIAVASLYPSLCLARALVLQYFLERYGQAATIRLGVRTLTGQFEAHAWVECDGRELNESEPANQLFTPFDWSSNIPAGSGS